MTLAQFIERLKEYPDHLIIEFEINKYYNGLDCDLIRGNGILLIKVDLSEQRSEDDDDFDDNG